MRAIGVSHVLLCRGFSLAMISAAAPSLTPDALPAVTEPPARNGALSLASCSSVVSGRGCSSVSTTIGSPLRRGISTATISLARRPDCLRIARTGLASERKGVLVLAADAEILGDVLAGLGHGIDAVLRLQHRLTKRQPMVVS
jgi:hypothetical protein